MFLASSSPSCPSQESLRSVSARFEAPHSGVPEPCCSPLPCQGATRDGIWFDRCVPLVATRAARLLSFHWGPSGCDLNLERRERNLMTSWLWALRAGLRVGAGPLLGLGPANPADPLDPPCLCCTSLPTLSCFFLSVPAASPFGSPGSWVPRGALTSFRFYSQKY